MNLDLQEKQAEDEKKSTIAAAMERVKQNQQENIKN
jgi:Na+-translocating ferredoxin:NAD+ oxidoreductase subunit C